MGPKGWNILSSNEAMKDLSPQDQTTVLARRDWIDAGLELLVGKGVDHVKITRLADALGVTRGSFYWHFKDRDDLLLALVEEWENRNTKALIDVLPDSEDITEVLLEIFVLWTSDEPFAPRLDAAMRDWARRSDTVKQAVSRADSERVKAIAKAFECAGFEASEAFIRARVLYFAQVGYYAMEVKEPLETRLGFAEAYVKSFTGVELPRERAEIYRARLRRSVEAGGKRSRA